MYVAMWFLLPSAGIGGDLSPSPSSSPDLRTGDRPKIFLLIMLVIILHTVLL